MTLLVFPMLLSIVGHQHMLLTAENVWVMLQGCSAFAETAIEFVGFIIGQSFARFGVGFMRGYTL